MLKRVFQVPAIAAFVGCAFMVGCAGPDVPSFQPLGPGEERVYTDSTGSEVICRYQHETGSRLGAQVCLTEERWANLERVREEGSDQLRRSAERSSGNQNNSTGHAPAPRIPPGS